MAPKARCSSTRSRLAAPRSSSTRKRP